MTDAQSTGILDLDILLGGGMPPGSLVLVKGAAATGKSTLALQIASHIARGRSEQCLYVAVEDDPSSILRRMDASYNFELERLTEEQSIVPVGLPELEAAARPAP